MFDTMTITKIAAALCGALLVFLLGNWASHGLFSVGGGGGHGENMAGYVVETGDEHGAEAEDVAEVPFEEIYAAADAGAGERLWRQCQACHQRDAGANGVGPYLHGVVGRAKGAVDGFGYSDAMASAGGDWTPADLDHFLESPRDFVPGTAMGYSGMRDAEDRANLISYLATLTN